MRITGSVVALTACTVILGACASAQRTPFTESDELAAFATDSQNIRYWADAPASSYEGVRHPVVGKGHQFSYLALSGGGGGGAYGAGILNGWTDSGTRPEFTMVSGVSTGALIAPFAFLGSAYDEKLSSCIRVAMR
jgi:hypothetical protein